MDFFLDEISMNRIFPRGVFLNPIQDKRYCGRGHMKDKPITEFVLLGALMSGPMHGYEILRFLDADLGSAWRVGTSQLYALLKRLESSGVVTSTVESQDTRPSKRVFSLNTAGKEAFMDWLKRPSPYVRDLRTEFLTKLFFFGRLSLQGCPALVRDQIKILEKVRERLITLQDEEKDPYKRMVFGFRIATLNGWLAWLEKEAVPFAKGNDQSAALRSQ